MFKSYFLIGTLCRDSADKPVSMSTTLEAHCKKQDQVTGLSRPLMPQKDLTANILPETSCGSSCSGGTKLAGLKNKASVIMKIQIPASAVGDNQRGIHLKHSCRS